MSEEGSGDSVGEVSTEAEGTGDVGQEDVAVPTPSEIQKMYKVRIDDQDHEVDEQELVRGYQLRKSSDKRFSEANQARKQSEEFIRLLKTDPQKVLSHPSIGLDLKKFAEEYLMTEMQQEMLTPEQRELNDYKSKLAKYEETEKTRKQEEETKAQEAVRQKYSDDYNKQITDALEVSGLPKTEHTVQRMIHYMHNALKNGYELSANDVTDLVRKDYISDTKALYSNLDGDALISILGDDIGKKLRKSDLNKLKSKQNNLTGSVPVDRGEDTPKSKGLSKDDWRAEIMRRVGS